MPSDEDLDGERVLKTPPKDSVAADASTLKNRPPQPLPRRALNFPAAPVYVNSAEIKITEDKNQSNLRKSFSAIYSPNSSKARGPSAQSWQN